MLISYDWLKQLIALDKPAEEVAALLTDSGLEVEGLETFEVIKGGLQGIVIGQVLTCDKHPDADKLKVTTVDIGAEAPKSIVCGAANVAAGQKVVVATEQATLYPAAGGSFQIKKSKIRGVLSEGMICAEDEIGLGSSHDGIMVLDTDLPNGTPAADYFGLASDTVFEIGLTPNRADAASHYGVARELQALLPERVALPDVSAFRVHDNSLVISIDIRDAEACPRYAGLSISGLQVGESPEWLRNRLKAIGLSPINNVVDVTNYVLHELGQPLHAFDADQVTGQRIVVQRAREGEAFVTLDGVERRLRASDLMICNAEEPMVIAGVFGGKKSGVSNTTTSIFLESAYFQPATVRKTSQVHNLKTDSSFRFERGTDPNMVPYALKRAALLIQQVAGGQVSSDIIDVYPQPVSPLRVSLKLSRVQQLIGQYISPERIRKILTDLQISIVEEKEEVLQLEVPPHKVDVTREADVIEEILRVYGYNNIVLKENIGTSFLAKFPKPNPEELKEKICTLLTGSGYSEIITNSLTDSAYYEKPEGPADEELVRIVNYNSEELDVMRKTLVFSGLEVLRRNINRKNKDLKLYELGKVYTRSGGRYKEQQQLALFLTGNREAETWQQAAGKVSFHQLAALVQQVLLKMGRNDYTQQPLQHAYLRAGVAYQKNDVVLAQLGLLDEQVARSLDVKEPVWYAELNWDWLLRNYKSQIKFEELAKFPEVRRDLSLVVDKAITFDQIKAIAGRTERKLLQDINVFDVYEGDKIEAGKKAYAISFTLLDRQQTLTDKVIDGTMNRLMQQFEKALGAVIRK
ncbi:MAG: phenylalanine--tRNA ligase subunit beta [Adhaeribacter sp.]